MNHRLVLIALLTLSVGGWAHAERIVLLPTSGTNIHLGYLDAAEDLLRGHLLATGRYEVVAVPGDSGSAEADGVAAATAAQQHQAQLAIVLHVTRLGSSAKLRMTVYDMRGSVVHLDQMKAGSPDDFDAVLKRMAVGLATGKPAKETADIDTVTESEADPLLKLESTNVFGIKLGGVLPFAEDTTMIPGGSLFWLYDMRTFLAEIDVGFHAGDDKGDFSVGIGAYLPLSRENTAPFVGGGLRWQVSDYGDRYDGSGLALFAGGGALIGRLNTVQIRLDANYILTTYRGDDGVGGEGKLAHGMAFSVGLGF